MHAMATYNYRVISNYDPVAPKDIALHIGDHFNKIKDISNGWAVGTNLTTGQTGYFPLSYVETIENIENKITVQQPTAPPLHPLHDDVVAELDSILNGG